MSELYHYGVKGMKWGRRKGRTNDDDVRYGVKRTKGTPDEVKKGLAVADKAMNNNRKNNLTPKQKAILKASATAAVAIGATVAINRVQNSRSYKTGRDWCTDKSISGLFKVEIPKEAKALFGDGTYYTPFGPNPMDELRKYQGDLGYFA